eukprot:CAMPEP_0197185658 /NCGR_PEP_ID=MMETSP1423-20130617/12384_1 /TAXON_ID=476441 /ORGANISM="Pseudo-nitzschia heimii, Strain UNC1101" /LENGTH=595 /DNA_ID=CAMNT_0042636783 /DNA_START=51 /DNA_END=1835 /DNA_ORIENTATION=+
MSPKAGEKSSEGYHGERKHIATEVRRDEDTIIIGYEVARGDKNKISFRDSTVMKSLQPVSEERSNEMVTSPAPVVEKGGENEFVKVSHLASVQVKAVPTPSTLKSKSEPRNVNKRHSTRRSEGDCVNLSSRSLSKKSRRRNEHERLIGDSQHDDFDDDSQCGEDTSHNHSEPLSPDQKVVVVIEKSPYETGACAESGESLFEEIKTLLLEHDESSEIAKMFGAPNANCLTKAYGLIEKSGMVYSQTWMKGSIRGNPVGLIPSHLLLMVLVPHRFVKASELLLSGLCRDLEVYNSVNKGLDDWGWAGDYELIRATKKNYKFKTNKRDCFKCAVFVARAHSCFHANGKRELEPRLVKKLKTCLYIMETHLVPPSLNGHHSTHTTCNGVSVNGTNPLSTSTKKKKKIADTKKVPDHVLSISSLAHSPSSARSTTDSTSIMMQNFIDHQDPSLKRKRGRAQKNSKHTTMQPQGPSLLSPPQSEQHESESIDSNEDQREPLPSKLKRNHHQSSRSRGGLRVDNPAQPLARRRSSSSRSASTVPTLHQLMTRFEDQYEEMGKRYAEMGELLAQMKTVTEENRERSEQEIRRELLDEIQRKI